MDSKLKCIIMYLWDDMGCMCVCKYVYIYIYHIHINNMIMHDNNPLISMVKICKNDDDPSGCKELL